jgi:hypothetical protein
MNFNIIYKRKLEFFPERIKIDDGKEVSKTKGFKSDNLWSLYEKAEDLTTSQAESYFIWAYYRVLHRKAKRLFKSKVYTIKTSEIKRKELKDEYSLVLQESETIEKTRFCCAMMTSQFKNKCELHDARHDCPNNLIDYSDNNKRFTLIIHDGTSSGIEIKYCPWCGKKLDKSK